MTRPAPAYIEFTVGDEDLIEEADEDEMTRIRADLVEDNNAWFDEKTQRIDFDEEELSPEAKLVAGYLTLEANDLFGHLPVEEQQQIAATLKAG